MTYSTQEITNQIKITRKEKGISQRALSAKVGLPQGHISKIENGRVDLQTSSLIEIARALDLELVLIPRTLLPAVLAIQHASSTLKSIPAYQLTDEDDDDS